MNWLIFAYTVSVPLVILSMLFAEKKNKRKLFSAEQWFCAILISPAILVMAFLNSFFDRS